MSGPVSKFLPFSAVVGLDDAKLALTLAAMAPRLGGVLLRGQKGSAKTTLARGLASLLPGEAPFVELPLGATEDRVLGSLDLAELLTGGAQRFRPGLLAAADGGVLYVDEINLLADHLVDALLDVAVSGVNRVERDSVSYEHAARFVLIGSMNPEEGELRPQLLDRFGLAVDVTAITDVDARVAAVLRQLGSESDAAHLDAHHAADSVLRERLATVGSATVDDALARVASGVALAVGAEGLRADLMLCRAAAALAAWEGRDRATEEDLRRVAPLVLTHRSRRDPFDEPMLSDDDLDDAFDAAQPDRNSSATDVSSEPLDRPEDDGSSGPELALRLEPRRAERGERGSSGARVRADAPAGRYVRARAAGPDSTALAAMPTAVAVATRRAEDPDAPPRLEDLREGVFEQKTGALVVIVLDTSASMGADRRIAAARGAILGLLTDAYQRRDRVALVAFGGDRAEVVLRPTASVEIARARIQELRAGGATPLAEGIECAWSLVRTAKGEHAQNPLVVVITDGRATPDAGAVARAHAAASRVARARIPTVVVDAEQGMPRLGLAGSLAAALGADLVSLDAAGSRAGDGKGNGMSDAPLESMIRARLDRRDGRSRPR